MKLDKKDVLELQNDFLEQQDEENVQGVAATKSRLNRVN